MKVNSYVGTKVASFPLIIIVSMVSHWPQSLVGDSSGVKRFSSSKTASLSVTESARFNLGGGGWNPAKAPFSGLLQSNKCYLMNC